MASNHATEVIQYLRRIVLRSEDAGLTDGQLLSRYLEERDADAFAALVKRHAPMVWGVCRRLLPSVQDAEDAFQATFLVLVRKAASVVPREMVANWLYGVAYMTAHRSKVSAAQRQRREKQVVQMPEPAVDKPDIWENLRPLLDRELSCLPDKYRAVILLCDLEGKTRPQAAQQLGLPEGTVASRLARARAMLAKRLARHGLVLSGAVVAAVLSAKAASAGVPASLVSSTIKAASLFAAGQAAATGVISVQVAALTEGVLKTMLLIKLTNAAAALIVGFVMTVGAGAVISRTLAVQLPKKENVKEVKEVPNEIKQQAVEVRGRVLDPDGRPVAGAKLYLSSREKEVTYPLRATSDGDGRFSFRYPRTEGVRRDSIGHAPPLKVLAVAKGYGCAWGSNGSAGKELILRLIKDAAVSGRIVDADGKSVANAKLTVDGVAEFTGAQKSGIAFAHTLPLTGYPWDAAGGWLGPLPDQGIELTTAADGRFQLAGVGPGRIVILHLEAPGITTTDLGIISCTPVQHVAVPSRPIRGVVRDKTTGQPLAGATVFVSFWPNPLYEEPRWGKTVTDKEGRYELLGLAKPPNYQLKVKPAKRQLYFQREVALRDTPGLAPLMADIDLLQGVTVRGKIIDRATHKPIPQARISYYPLWGNGHGNSEAQSSGATTEADGSYALTVHPGPGVIAVICRNPDEYMPALVTIKELNDFFTFTLPRGNSETWLTLSLGGGMHPLFQSDYNALVLLKPKEGDKALVKDIILERALERNGHVVGPGGQPISGVTVTGLSNQLQGRLIEALEGTEFTVRGIHPRRKRLIVFHHKEKNLGYCLKELPDKKLGPLTINLQPCGSISGRIVDSSGMPAASGRVYVQGGTWGQFLTLDKEGRFHLKGLVPGLEYSINDNKRPMILHDDVVVEPGKEKVLGDIKVSDN